MKSQVVTNHLGLTQVFQPGIVVLETPRLETSKRLHKSFVNPGNSIGSFGEPLHVSLGIKGCRHSQSLGTCEDSGNHYPGNSSQEPIREMGSPVFEVTDLDWKT